MKSSRPGQDGEEEIQQKRREKSVCDSEKTEKELRETERERE